MEDIVVCPANIEVGANQEVGNVGGCSDAYPRLESCRVLVPKLQEQIDPFPKIYCEICLRENGKIIRFGQSGNKKVHIGYCHTAYESRRFICNERNRRFVTKQDLTYHVGKQVCRRGNILKAYCFPCKSHPALNQSKKE